MMKCPICRTVSHTRSSEYVTDTLKYVYYQCRNVECSCTFKTTEHVCKLISIPKDCKNIPVFEEDN